MVYNSNDTSLLFLLGFSIFFFTMMLLLKFVGIV